MLTDGPRNYSSSSRCMWIINGQEGSGPLLLKLDSFVTECSWDHVYVYDGNGVYGEQLAAFRYISTLYSVIAYLFRWGFILIL